jgi:hypothetical protein
MNPKLMKTTVRGALAALLALTFTPLLASDAGKIEGAWNVEVTVRDCTTGQPVATAYRMITFEKDGSIQEFAAFFNPLNPVRRGPGQGVWSHSTSRNYSYDVQFFRLNADFTLAGWNREHGEVVLDVSGTTFTGTHTAQIFDVNGNLLFTACATDTATRLF